MHTMSYVMQNFDFQTFVVHIADAKDVSEITYSTDLVFSIPSCSKSDKCRTFHDVAGLVARETRKEDGDLFFLICRKDGQLLLQLRQTSNGKMEYINGNILELIGDTVKSKFSEFDPDNYDKIALQPAIDKQLYKPKTN